MIVIGAGCDAGPPRGFPGAVSFVQEKMFLSCRKASMRQVLLWGVGVKVTLGTQRALG